MKETRTAGSLLTDKQKPIRKVNKTEEKAATPKKNDGTKKID